MGKKKTPSPNATDTYNRSVTAYNNSQHPSDTENELKPLTQDFANNYHGAVENDKQTYGNLMQGFGDYGKNAKFSYNPITVNRPKELTEGYGYLREAAPGYRDFANTGGYSAADQQELRARGMAPIRSAYGNTMMQMDRARALGGNGGAPNYIAAAARAQREVPGQMADAMTGVNAKLAEDIRTGKLAGLAGLSGIGATMGGMAGDESGRILNADINNQNADIQTQGMKDRANQFALSGASQLYGTTPGMSSMFGSQALHGYDTRAGMEQNRNNYGLGLLDAQMRSTQLNQQKNPWWKTALGVAGTVAPYVAMAASSRTLKEDIKPVKNVSKFSKHLKDLPLYTWKYKGDKVTHFGPIAEEFKEKMGIGDGKTLHLADVMGVVLASQKEQLMNADA